MSTLFNDDHRSLQDQFETRNMADRIEAVACKDFVDQQDQHFIENQDMFFLATVDAQGNPTVSYKGGDIGVVQVLDEKTLIFPSYDGNGMFLSMGNIVSNKEIGLLFIDFETPRRLRVQAHAEVSHDPELLALYHEADLIVKATVFAVFQNCPRYVHPHKKSAQSQYTPRPDKQAPMATWKRIDGMQDVLPERDASRITEAGGIISAEQWAAKIENGDIDA